MAIVKVSSCYRRATSSRAVRVQRSPELCLRRRVRDPL